jgi:hypothetical protein
MSQETLESRVGEVEREQARQGAKLDHLTREVGDVSAGVKTLLERDARRPQAMTWQTIVATCGGLAAVAFVGWWLIGTAPAVQSLDKRLSRLDDPEVGRIPRVEKKIQELEAWRPSITRY